jgi:hypothetical protein
MAFREDEKVIIEAKEPFDDSNQVSLPETGTEMHTYEDGWGDTSNDLRDMRRLGKAQEFKVRHARFS